MDLEQREIKFRCWDVKDKYMTYPEQCVDDEWAHLFTYKDHIMMQYIGLKDETGKDIYEGDILLQKVLDEEVISVVKYKAPCFYPDGQNVSGFALKEKFKIIGNIYENEDLIN